MSAVNTAVLEYLRDLTHCDFWGTIALKFERGAIVHVKKEENIKPSELSETPRKSNGQSHN